MSTPPSQDGTSSSLALALAKYTPALSPSHSCGPKESNTSSRSALDEMLSRPTPLDIVLRVAQLLLRDSQLATLSALHRCSRETYAAILPMLFRSLDIRQGSSDHLLLLAQTDIANLDLSIVNAVEGDTYFSHSNACVRRLNALRYTRHMTVHSLPSDPLSQSFLSSSARLPFPIFPNLSSVSLAPSAADEIRTWIPATYGPRNPPFLQALTKTCQPRHLCIAFRVVPSDEWEEHRDSTVQGQYQFVSRINRLIEDGWTRLESLTVHDIVHQVLPSLPGCQNTYVFSSHLIITPAFPQKPQPRFVPPGPDATYTPGPSYLFRAWQLGTAIKNLFPSGVDSRKVLESGRGTTWQFVNLAGHVLTKLVRDDDDESGVGWDEVDTLVQGSMQRGLPQDLPMREGFGKELVGEVFERISYVKGDGQGCHACHRSDQSGTTISRAQDLGMR